MDILLKIAAMVLLGGCVLGDNQSQPATIQDNVAQYVGGPAYSPPSAYQYTEPNYGPVQNYDGNYLMPTYANNVEDESALSSYQYFGSVIPYAKGRSDTTTITPEMIILAKILIKLISIYWHPELAKRLAYRLITKVGLFLLGGSLLLVVGGLFTTAVCSLTPICTIQFMGYGINRETMRSFMTPDNLSAASAFVHEAIDKYQKLQTSTKHN